VSADQTSVPASPGTPAQALGVSRRSSAASVLDLLRRLLRTRFGAIGLLILLLVSILSVFAPWFATSSPLDLGTASLQPPSWEHPLGTDNLGRDIRSVMLYAGRSSLTIGFCAAFMAFLIGGTFGALAGYLRGPVAAVLLRITDLFHTLPAIIIVLFSVSLLGSNFWLQVAAVALAIWPIEARLVYGQFIALSEREFVLAARAAGLSGFHIIFREILPNALPTVLVQISLDASTAILIEAGLGFLGLSDPTVPSWGEMLNRGQEYLELAWWMSVFPGLAICLAVLGFNLFADGLTEMFNPRASAAAPKLQS
jgi:peptide/nickel transport system permease protein